MMAITEPGTAIITVMVCTQLMKTALIENAFGFFAHLDPSPMLMLQPKEDAAEQFSKERITPLIKATPVLKDLIGTRKTRNSDETIRYKSFPGGFLAIEGAGSPDNVARRPIKRVFCDEIDKYVPTREGDAVGLAEERMGTFIGAQSIRACSPTIEGESAIEASYNEGDQRQATVACPQCQHRQFLEFFAHIDWDKTRDADDNVIAHQPKTAAVHCEACGAAWTEAERLAALKTARWHQTKPFRCCDTHQSPLATYDAAWREGTADPVGVTWDWWQGPRWEVYRARCVKCGEWGVDNEHASFTAGKEFSPWPRDGLRVLSDLLAKWTVGQSGGGGGLLKLLGLAGSASGAVDAGGVRAGANSALDAIPRNATGTEYFPGGMSVVGEFGKELVSLPRGSRVTPAAETRRMLAGNDNERRMQVEVVPSDYFDVRVREVASPVAQAHAEAVGTRAVAGSVALSQAETRATSARRLGRRW
ncbi:phage terminase large subunit family protein [Sphingomonas citricola]|uniref:phage terminase large subunit family protein n=1 Tax=Sphingomonas citricola TaxID=2862498 RepID=UPI0027E4D734|nr:phage terminase large subunit family protein [Sphingomonas citricola]